MQSRENKRASIKDVAALAGTSIATTSRVLNNTGYSSDDVRARVLAAASQLNYHPNLAAKGLRKQTSQTIGLLIPNLLNAYYTSLADSASQRLTAMGYQLLLSSTRDDPAIESATLARLIGHNVDGILWVPTAQAKKQLDMLTLQHIPAVSIVRKIEGGAIDTIVFEDYNGSRAATQHLIQLGHRRIGFIGGDTRYSSNFDRRQGFFSALRDAGIGLDESLVRVGSVQSTWGSIAAEELLRMPDPPTALFLASNAMAPGVMKSLRQHALKIPGDISLICFDDLDWFTYSEPPISAIATSHEKIAEAAVDLLLQRVEHPQSLGPEPVFMHINFDLILRHSTATPRNQ
jgi:LacI family transcriptional regulator